MSAKEKVIVITQSRWLPWVLFALLIIASIFFYTRFSGMLDKKDEFYENYKRQVAGKLTEKERELQESDYNLGIAKANFLTEKKLKEKYEKENIKVNKDFEEFKKKHKLKIRNYEKAIAGLKTRIKGGSVVVEGECETRGEGALVLKYKYISPYGRVVLIDSDIFTKDNEILEMNQRFKIFSDGWIQKDGSLQTKRLVLTEVVQKEDGSYFEIGKAELIDYEFNYFTEPPSLKNESWIEKHLDLFSMIGNVGYGYNSGLKFGIGIEWVNFKDVGLGLITTADIEFDAWEKSGISLGISYRIPKTNVGMEVLFGSSFVGFGNDYYVNGAFVFYIW